MVPLRENSRFCRGPEGLADIITVRSEEKGGGGPICKKNALSAPASTPGEELGADPRRPLRKKMVVERDLKNDIFLCQEGNKSGRTTENPFGLHVERQQAYRKKKCLEGKKDVFSSSTAASRRPGRHACSTSRPTGKKGAAHWVKGRERGTKKARKKRADVDAWGNGKVG